MEAKQEKKSTIQSRNWRTIKQLGNLDELKWSDRRRFTDAYVRDLRTRVEAMRNIPILDVKENRRRRSTRAMQNEIKRIGNNLEFILDDRDTKLKLELSRAAKNDNSQVIDFYVNREIDSKLMPAVLVEAVRSNKPYYFQVGQTTLNLNAQSGQSILHLYKGLTGDPTFDPTDGSDPVRVIAEYVKFNKPILKLKQREAKGPEKAGARFNFYNKSAIDLKRYQIYTKEEDISNEHCFTYALRQLKFPQAILNQVSLCLSNTALSKKFLKNIAAMLECNIILHYYRSNGRMTTTNYIEGNHEKTIDLALYKKHYFVYEETKYSKFFTNNYKKCMKYKQPHKIIKFKGTTPNRAGNRKANSLTLVRNFMEAGLFKKFTKLSKMEKNITFDLSNIAKEQRLFNNKPKTSKPVSIFYADVESDVTGSNHKFLMGGIIDQKAKDVFITKDVSKMFDYIVDRKSPNPVVYFHNLKYDFHVIGRYLNVIDSLEKDGQYYTVTVLYKKTKIILKDSYKLIPRKLSDFKKMFGLESGKKEAINYRAYSVGMDDFYSIKKYRKGLRPEERKIFDEEYPKVEVRGSKFNAMAYYKQYLESDVLTLRQGLEKMNQCVKQLTDPEANPTNVPMSLYDYNTISSLGHYWAVNKGCYDGLFEVSGGLRHFLSQAVYGGRVNVNKDYQKKIIKGMIQDFDGVSLYPSAMNRIANEAGLPIGECKRFENHIPKCDYYVAKISLKAINKKQQNPFIALRTGDSLEYVNEIKEPTIMVLDKTTIEDYEKFHKIDYDILEGVYWNQGVNKKIGCINELFQARLVYKKAKNEPMQQTVKLIMNSIYGKSITKKSNKKIKYMYNDKKADNYITKNFETISTYTKSVQWVRIEESTIDLSYNLSIVGSTILSMSKRIMNEVMATASDFNIPIMYQDTDSMHMFDRDVKPLAKLYKAQYGKNLIGKNLEQFHCDFSMKGCKEVHSTGSIFLGKKAYIDRIVGDGKKVDYHIRLKGVSNPAILNTVTKKGFDNPFQLYEHLLKHPTNFCLNFDKHHINFVYGNGGVSTMRSGTFNRMVNFT